MHLLWVHFSAAQRIRAVRAATAVAAAGEMERPHVAKTRALESLDERGNA